MAESKPSRKPWVDWHAIANPPRDGSRGRFVRHSVSLPPAMLEAVGTAARGRKARGEIGATVSAIAREALADWLAKQYEP